MTERFTLIDMNNIEWKLISPIKDNGRDVTVKQVVELLNAQHEEIQQSKVLIKKYHNENTDLIKENEQLNQYKQVVSDVLLLYSQKNLSAKQLGLLTAIMHELGVWE